jgi:hypothetical protein
MGFPSGWKLHVPINSSFLDWSKCCSNYMYTSLWFPTHASKSENFSILVPQTVSSKINNPLLVGHSRNYNYMRLC